MPAGRGGGRYPGGGKGTVWVAAPVGALDISGGGGGAEGGGMPLEESWLILQSHKTWMPA